MSFKMKCSAFIVLFGFATSSSASVFNVFFNNASDLGNAFAGEAAVAENSATLFTNPAGMVRIDHPQLVGGLDIARLGFKYKGSDIFVRPPVVIPSYGSARSKTHVQPFPFIYYSSPINCFCKLHAGFGITLLGGQGGIFSKHSVLRYTTQKQQLGIIDVTPSVAFQINPQFSLGLGLDIAYLMLTNTVLSPTPLGTDAKLKGNFRGVGYGWHGGLLYQITPCSRVGLTYHSQINFKPSGQGEFIPTPNETIRPEVVSNNVRTNIKYASYTEIAGYHQFNDHWVGLASLGYNHWSTWKFIHTRNVPIFTPQTGPTGIDIIERRTFQNTFRLAGAVNYKLTECVLLRGGISYETAPTVTRLRTIPGFKRIAYFAIGAHYQRWKNVGFDAGILHAVLEEPRFNTKTGNTFLHGKGVPERDAIGAQVVWDII